ncbi:hypothetical protein [Nocardioides sp. KR10-350]|uniref:hypothetical protein n=1 Tax=Nocardioides cheoyonin TaxID=3156615 RepID=UPI0032B48470
MALVRLAFLVLVPVLALVAGAGQAVAPAYAVAGAGAPAARQAGCSGGHGVAVVVEPNALGGEPEMSCDEDGGGRTADRIFADAGHTLTAVRTAPDFVCRVDGRPADASCAQVPPADAYWSLWWTDGSSPWVYSSLAAGGLEVPDGGAVAFTWVQGASKGTPATGVAAAVGDAAAPSAGSVSTGSTTGSDGSSTDARSETDDSSGGGGLPGWVAPVVVLVVLGGAVAVGRRRRS